MKKVLIGFSLFGLLLTLLPLIPLQYGLIRMWSYPRLQIAVLMGITLVGWAFFHRHASQHMWLIVAVVAATVYQLTKFLPYTFVWKPEIVDTKTRIKDQEISILFYNVYMYNQNTTAFINLAKEVDADLVLMAENDEFWRKGTAPLYADYPYKVEVPLPNTYGMCLYSKLPLSQTKVKFLVEPDIPSIHTIVTLPSGQPVRLYCIHPEPPGPSKSTKDRDAELVIVAKDIAKEKLPVLVAGDLNDVAWSSTTKLFGEISQCNDPRVGRGLFSTFNAKYPIFRWPLDHFFASKEFTLNDIKRLPKIGSDHFPIFTRLTYNPASAALNKTKQAEKADLEKAEEKLKEEKKEDQQQ
ncbi:endonuclease [Segetibacter sp. 3557_3]|uniref:endonuclease/exonuclease/phosphatase family protein n=1 Tax=Segetibacter sp. 3557_3 TaxID=2547429 RepID=UPI0010586D1D|nr:endonuclease/exonuclease/phosphatase family protein [Segetibacter sp. 3557_3]TDH20698.1 endonuclease [Segetibacter sp. 3557_3]